MKFLILGFCLTIASAQFICPPKDDQYPDEIQCDKFYECKDGQAKTKLCPDGLVFNPEIRKRNKCDQPFNVDCGDRTELQPPQPKGVCPRQNGFFAHENPKICNRFYNCIHGEHIEVTCTAGLYFDEYSGICVWPESSERTGCDVSNNQLTDGFSCPTESQKDNNGNLVIHPKFAHPSDCQKFYVCLNGIEARELGCQVGEVYNEELQKCDAPENVQGCEDWYMSEPPPSPPKATKKS
ncbi:unnamed protein product [Phyllotreta striolata]|uniref:Chitin-binding type-2 domain-containing protein n=1 Tax=Phyllotreta striolata TaxID=444603 RepID=A0A9N9TVH4_PHYSR|nr:unnamed protein product [Phyllotreta striolata]